MSHFYVISEQLSPLMAWGFFGPNENLKEICHYFRDETLGFLADIFSFQKCRYTSVEELSEDIYQHMKNRVNNISVKFSQQKDFAFYYFILSTETEQNKCCNVKFLTFSIILLLYTFFKYTDFSMFLENSQVQLQLVFMELMVAFYS